MARKRMFSLEVVDTDRFLDMGATAQALYFHLGMHADDDGFVSSPKKISRAAGCNDDDLRLLAAKGFIIPFESGVVVITDWKRNNSIKGDRYRGTVYTAEKALISDDGTGKYQLGTNLEPCCIQYGAKSEPQVRLGKVSVDLGEKREDAEADKPPSRSKFIPPTLDEVRDYCRERANAIDPEGFVDFYQSKGWKVGSQPMKDWKSAVRTWERRDKKSNVDQQSPGQFQNIPGVAYC